MIKTILITNDPSLAADAQAAGVSRIMVDLESHGKKERQASRTTFISSHAKDDIEKIRAVLTSSQLIVRINPWHEHSLAEVDHAVDAGADMIMLPMITQMSQVEDFVNYLAGRAKPLPLIETAYSMAHISDIAAHAEIAELYIGLNDLHLSLGLDFLFEPLANGLLEWTATQIKAQGKSFGFGGIATMGSGELPAEKILGEHARLGSTCVILSSRFGKDLELHESQGRKKRLTDALFDLQNRYQLLCKRPSLQQEAEARETAAIIELLAVAARSRAKQS